MNYQTSKGMKPLCIASAIAMFAVAISCGASGPAAAGLVLGVPPERTVTFDKSKFPEPTLRRQQAEESERRFREPIKDEHGHIRYIVDFTDRATELWADTPQPFDHFAPWEKPAMRNFARALGSQHGFKPLIVTSWVGNSLVAHLNENQFNALRADPRVTRITPDARVRLSSSLWDDAWGPQWQWVSWGTIAVGGYWGYEAPTDNVRVYIIDSGVGDHVDLPNVVERYSAYVPPPPLAPIFPVGCYSHATHVAGIVGATGTGAYAASGVDRGVKMVSININTANDDSYNCSNFADFSTTTGIVAAALSLAKARISQTGKFGIVNISANSPTFRSDTTIGSKLRELTITQKGYRGALVVMSAGNKMQSNCEETYEEINNADGVIVVGGMDTNGQHVVSLNERHAYHPSPNPINDPDNGRGSSYGPCVTMYAPSTSIYSSWGGSPQTGTGLHSDRIWLSGTSMAAPHIAGIAAYVVAAGGGVWNPGLLEAHLRSLGGPLQSSDMRGHPIWLVKHPVAGTSIPAALPTAEFLIRKEGVDHINPPASLGLWTYTDVPFTLRYDSRGATSCTINAWVNGVHWYTVPNYSPRWNWGDGVLIPGATYTWQVDCVSPHGTHNTASATITGVVPPPPPELRWYVNDVDRTGQTVSLSAWQPFNFRWESVNTHALGCNLTVEASWDPDGVWYTAENIPAAWDWDGPVSLPPGLHKYDMRCDGPRGSVRQWVRLDVQ